MLDSELDINAATTPEEAPKRSRRRAASRPAGPPTPVSQTVETPAAQAEAVHPEAAQSAAAHPEAAQSAAAQPELPAPDDTGADVAPAKKTATRKTAVKKTAAKKTAAKKTTPRKAAAKKTAAESPGDQPEAAAASETAVAGSAADTATALGDAGDNQPAATTAAKKTAPRKAAAKRGTRKAAESVTADTGETPSAESDESADAVKASEVAEPAVAVPSPEQPASEEPSPEQFERQEQAAPIQSADNMDSDEELQPAEELQPPTADLSIQAAIESAMNATLAERGQPSDDDSPQAQVAESAALEAEAPDGSPTDEGTQDVTVGYGADAESSASEDGEDADNQDDADSQDDGGGRRRRRRRGGRRRRRERDRDGFADDADASDDGGEGAEDAGEDTGGEAPAQPAEVGSARNTDRGAGDSADEGTAHTAGQSGEEAETADDDSDDGDSGDGQRRRRRRRRRRRGEDTAGSPDDPSDVVVRVREPRKASDEVTGIDGSTRMEAKRQRRREGREAGRRRAPIISEAEFLARRESVDRKMIIRQREDLSQIAVLEDGILVEHYVDRESANSLIGNVYLGRVQNVLPSMEAAFIDIGRGRNAVLYAGEVDWDSYGAEGQNRKVENILKSGQTVLVQVTKDPVGAKGARLTNHVSIPGRYVVYAPGGHLSGISRKLPDNERKRLKDILDAAVDDSASVIVRTAAEGASEDELTRDVNRLKAQWEDIEKKVKSGNAPQLLYAEPDLTLRIVRDLFTEDFSELIVQGNRSMSDAYDALEAYMAHVAPHLADRIKRWDDSSNGDLFGSYRLDEQIAKGLERKVFLPSGGSLIIDRTEAMTVIDVNTGKFTGSGGNLEATITSNNLEAAEEIVRQLRLRDIGGIIVIDFIDMVLPNNRELLLRRLIECLGRDRTRHQVAEVTSLGLVQMTRKRIGTGLLEAFSTECPHCHGRGVELHDMPVTDVKLADGGAREDHNGGRGRRRTGKSRKGSDNKNETKPESKNKSRGEHNGDKGSDNNAENAPAQVPAAD